MRRTPTPGSCISWVLLTMGDRSDELAKAIKSIPLGDGYDTEIIVVANGASGLELDEQVTVLNLPENVGVPEGRNRGARLASGQIVVFLDDDAEVTQNDLSLRLLRQFNDQPDLAIVAFRIVDPESGQTSRRHVPRVGSGDPDRSGYVTSFLGGACAVRRDVFEKLGGLPGSFFYALEETDFAWRCIDDGWRVFYDAGAVIHHPKTDVARHSMATRLTSRNRVLLARRLLPWPLILVYTGNWFLITCLRSCRWAVLREYWAGTREGLAASVNRIPIKWRTVWCLTRLGRPPLY